MLHRTKPTLDCDVYKKLLGDQLETHNYKTVVLPAHSENRYGMICLAVILV
nr:MAG TPA: hypothetical protein [Caudoviricetes sp.]DAY38534.1 MAG TPA: hypothetical protein [Bacteriophage sp.]